MAIAVIIISVVAAMEAVAVTWLGITTRRVVRRVDAAVARLHGSDRRRR